MIPYYSDDHVALFHGDRREMIAPDFRADLLCTDPPYGETSLDWDRWPDGWPELAARHSDAMWCFGSMRMFLNRRDEFAAWKLSQDVVWRKNRGSGFATDRFARIHEHALHWYQGEWSAIAHETPRIPRTGPEKAVTRSGVPSHTGKIGRSSYVDDGLRLTTSVIYHRNLQGTGPLNPTQKPVPLLEPLLTYGCPPGGVVLDLFAGSCSTGRRSQAHRAPRRAVREA